MTVVNESAVVVTGFLGVFVGWYGCGVLPTGVPLDGVIDPKFLVLFGHLPFWHL